MEQADTLCGLFDEPAEDDGPAIQIFVPKPKKVLTRNDPELPKIRLKYVHEYRTFKEDVNIGRYLNLVLIFVKIATKAPYPLEMLQNVANPYFVKILLQMVFQVSVKCKLQILTIF